MSKQTIEWLNTMTLIGFTDKRGHAWHYRKSNDLTVEPNHYAGAIPEEDVRRRLFSWTAVEGTVSSMYEVEVDGVTEIRATIDPDRKTMIHPLTGDILGIFKDGYRQHDYATWLIDHTAAISSSGLAIASAGLLDKGGVAWLQAEMPETISTAQGIDFRPFIGAASSLNGTLASTYFTGAQLVVCDNTLSAGLGSATHKAKRKHTSRSLTNLADIQKQLQLIYEAADDFQAELDALCAIEITDKQWDEFLSVHCLPKNGEMPTKGRGLTMYEKHRDELGNLYRNDMRVAPWAGTAFGVVQAVNTHATHVKTVKGMDRAQRNANSMVRGEFEKLDTATMAELNKVLQLV